MMMGKDDLGLSLSLSSSSSSSSPNNHLPLQLNLTIPSSSSASSPSPPLPSHQKTQWSDLLVHSEIGRVLDLDVCGAAADPRPPSLHRGIDVNQEPPGAGERDSEEDAGASSPNSTLSSVSGKRAERSYHLGVDEHDPDRDCSRWVSDEEDGEGSPRKKLRLSKDQAAILEESFKEHNTLNPKQKLALVKRLNLRPRQVEVWFQNRRARTKLKQTEVDCEFLKRCCETLTEENRRLQKEVQELRALKVSPQLYMHMTPPTTLTMCPSCQRVSNSATTTASTPSPATDTPHPMSQHHRFIHHRPIPLRPCLNMPLQRS
ncbi:hypothetical protein OPV22_032407 [Ensete ventricosum]|uniref:Homeobox domain-containing protein n=1 Tax=Ensete ventricosum TaxID=4639 RepID=A0AAV8PMI4_ENSVE|nr:hypothetical protein OPV22_032407 [Ensete ventricosum]